MAKMSQDGLALLKSMEGLSLDAYPDGGGWSIGYGHHGKDVFPGMQITQQRADDLLASDLERFETGVEQALTQAAHQEEFDAMVDFAYNVGLAAFRDSTLLAHVNAGRHAEAAAEFGKWVYGDPNEPPLPGLVKRREREAALYRRGGRAGG
jgi:lysozyme